MGVPRHHMAKGKQELIACSHCKKMIKPHLVCSYCGFYKGREVVNVMAKTLKKQEKMKMRSAQ